MATDVKINDIASQLNTASRLVVDTDSFWIYMANGSQVKIPAEFVRAYLSEGLKPTVGENGNWYVGGVDTSVKAEAVAPLFRGGAIGIEVSYDKGQTWETAVEYADMNPDLDPLVEAYKKVTSGEEERISNENARKQSELDRQSAENTRKTAETTRQNQESTRNTNENTRKSNETTRESNEATRKTNETNRNNAENTRKSNETTRQSQEATRQSNESTRKTNETNRSNAEAARAKAETARDTAEKARASAESKRETDFAASKAAADDATAKALSTYSHPPYVNSDGYYYKWNVATSSYNKTDVNLTGKAFQIKKVFSSVSAMNTAGAASFDENDFILINTANVEDEDNAKLYVVMKNSQGAKVFSYLVDMSGFRGFTGKTPQMMIGTVTTMASGSKASAAVVASGTDNNGNPQYKINLGIPKGDKITLADLTDAEIAQLQKPATDAIAKCDAATSAANTATSKANAATTAANNAATAATKTANDAAAAAKKTAEDAAANATAKANAADALNTKVSKAEEARSAAETARAEAETQRAQAEEDRATVEQTRKDDENTRIANETARGKAESARVSAESSRASAESARVKAESSRASAETSRASAETQRAQAESSRATAETARVKAETSRQSGFQTALGNVNAAIATATDTATHPTKVGTDNYVYIWDKDNQEYIKTAIYVKGDKGDKGDKGEKGDQGIQGVQGEKGKSPTIKNGNWWLYDETKGAYVDSGISVSSDYVLTKTNVESVLTGNITTHSHGQYALATSLQDETSRATQAEAAIRSVVDVINGASTVEGSFRKAIADLIGGAPEALDTLKEIADKLAADDDLHNTIEAAIALKADQTAVDAVVKRLTAVEGGSAATVEVTGTGNAITALSKTGTKITATKGATFLTSHQSLAGYYTKTECSNTFATKSVATTTANGLMSSTDKQKLDGISGSIPTKTSQLTNDSGYITKDDLKETVTISLRSNQSTSDASLKGATITVKNGSSTLGTYTWQGTAITMKVAGAMSVTVSVSAVSGYRMPSAQTFTTVVGNSRSVTMQYDTEVVTVTVKASNGANMNGQIITVNGTAHNWQGLAFSQKIPYGTAYTVTANAKSLYSTPATQSYTAGQATRSVTLTYTYSPLGIWIVDSDGNLTATDSWNTANNSKAVGVAVLTEKARFIISKSDQVQTSWSSQSNFVQISGICTTTNQSSALLDFAGASNTSAIAAQDTQASAAIYCQGKSINGKKCYLWSLGEMQEAYNNKSAVDAALSKIGGTAMVSTYYWTSTQYDPKAAWMLYWSRGGVSMYNKSNGYYVRAVCAF